MKWRGWGLKEKKPGFEKVADLPAHKLCRHPEHNPPEMIVLEPGIYHYTCPGCGWMVRVEVWPQQLRNTVIEKEKK